MTDVVIGSGPAGVAVAEARLALGRQVLMIDAGAWMEPQADARRKALAASDPSAWRAEDVAAYKAPHLVAPTGQIMRFGSAFAVERPATLFEDPPRWLALRSSRARGGLSNVWGSAVLPYRQADIADWPVTADALAPHYRAVAGFMPVAAGQDALSEWLPSHAAAPDTALDASPQGAALAARFGRRASALEKLGARFGGGRQAVASGCRLCGLCLYGCPWRLIFSAADRIEALRQNPAFTYRAGQHVQSFAETGDQVTVTCEGGEAHHGERLFIATGVLETARLLFLSGREAPLTLQDSQYALMPMLHAWSPGKSVVATPHHTLTQGFVEIGAAEISPYLVHTQLYTWNDFYAREMRATYGKRLPFLGPFFDRLARRLIVGQTFLHSAHSGRIRLQPAAGGKMTAEHLKNPLTDRVLTAARKRLSAVMRLAGVHALTPASRPGAPGSSFHVGGSVPMRAEPGAGDSDLLGRPNGLSRVHVVDASVLPSIPATTITFSVMANAHRIGIEAG